ncbi:MAG TPA: hypothetical protein VFN76_09910 [Candidatus Limnocylindria bacterium]|nr:hypothetical protein [Candidatus Limnocylindria bacterium]
MADGSAPDGVSDAAEHLARVHRLAEQLAAMRDEHIAAQKWTADCDYAWLVTAAAAVLRRQAMPLPPQKAERRGFDTSAPSIVFHSAWGGNVVNLALRLSAERDVRRGDDGKVVEFTRIDVDVYPVDLEAPTSYRRHPSWFWRRVTSALKEKADAGDAREQFREMLRVLAIDIADQISDDDLMALVSSVRRASRL